MTALLGAAGSFGWIRLISAAETNPGTGFGLPFFVVWAVLVGLFFVQTLRTAGRVRRLKDQARLFE